MKATLTSAAVLLVLHVAAGGRAEDSTVRRELQAAYARIAAADRRSDANAYCAMLTPDFKHKYRVVKWESPESIRSEFSMRGKDDPIRTVRYTIGSLEVKGSRAVATVNESESWETPGTGGGRDKVEKLTRLRSTWIRTSAGWRLQLEEELDNSRYFKNAKPDRD